MAIPPKEGSLFLGIPDIVYWVSILIPLGVIPDIFNRASILAFFGWIPAPANDCRGKL